MAQSLPSSIVQFLCEKPQQRFKSADVEDALTSRHTGPAFANIDTICSALNTLATKKKIRRFRVYGFAHQYEYQAL